MKGREIMKFLKDRETSFAHFMRACLVLAIASILMFASWGCEPPGTSDPDYDTFSDGPHRTTQDLGSGPSGNSGLFYPTGVGTEGKVFPIFLWCCGGGSAPRDYAVRMNRIASHGFVVIAEVSSGSGEELIEALEWLIEQNNNSRSPLYKRLDISPDYYAEPGGCSGGGTVGTVNVAAGGHSLGSVGTFAIADDSRLRTTIHVAGGSFDGRGPNNLRNPAAYLAGENDSLATSNVERDYRNTTVPVFMTVMKGVGHIDATEKGLPAIIAWLHWHLGGQTWRQADFLQPGGVFTTGMWKSKSKNW